jgi:hypothetical protein
MKRIADIEETDPRGIDILSRALTLRMVCNGSMDAFWLKPHHAEGLRWRVENWKPTLLPADEPFDNAVKALAIEALRIYDASMWPAFFVENPHLASEP